jgi:gliding motility-associated-like protein
VDACGNVATASQSISITDTQKPVLAGVPSNTTVECGDALPVANVSATDVCFGQIQVTMTENSVGSGCNRVITRTWTAVDSCGNTATATQTITVTDTQKPVFSGVPVDTTIECGVTLPVANVTAIDQCEGQTAVSYTETTQGSGCNKLLLRTWATKDGCGNTNSVTQRITVRDTKQPVLSGIPANISVSCGTVIPVASVTAFDACLGQMAVSFSEVQTGSNCNKILTRTWTAADSCGNTAIGVQVITFIDTEKPVLAGVPADVTLNCGADIPAVTVTATDNCDASVLVTLSTQESGSGCNRRLTRTWTATDSCGNVATGVQVISFTDTEKPTLVGIPVDATIECGTSLPAVPAVTAVDGCDGNLQVQFTEVSGGQGCNRVVTRTWRAVDACGNVATASQRITIRDTKAPVFSQTPGDLKLNDCASVPPAAQITAVDACGNGAYVEFGELQKAEQCKVTITRTWTASDDCGNTATHKQVIEIEDKTGPILVNVPANVTVDCNEIPEPATLIALDNCLSAVNIALNETNVKVDSCTRRITRTWIATDTCGNSTTATQVITAVDRTAPVITFLNPALAGKKDGDTVLVDCNLNSVFSDRDARASDPCTGAIITYVEAPAVMTDCGLSGYYQSIRRTWTATDSCGNKSSVSLQFLYRDKVAPKFVFVPNDTTIDCGNTVPPFGTPVAADECSLVQLSHITDSIATNSGYLLKRTWLALDACGNSISASQTIKVYTSSQPVFAGVPKDTIIYLTQGGEVPDPANVTAKEACSGRPLVVTQSDTIIKIPETCDSLLIRTWTATSQSGIEESVSQQIRLVGGLDVQVFTQPDTCTSGLGSARLSPVGYTYQWADGFSGSNRSKLLAGAYKVFASNGDCVDSLEVVISNYCKECEPLFTMDSIDAQIVVGEDSTVCVPLPYIVSSGYDIFLDGKPYTAGLGPCNESTVVFYSYALVIGQGKTGPYLATWRQNGDTLKVTVNNMDELVAAMNTADPEGHWEHNPLFFGFSSPNIDGDYHEMTIKHLGTQVTAYIQTNYSSTPMGTTLVVPAGLHKVVFIDKRTECRDTLVITVKSCESIFKLDTLSVIVEPGKDSTVCLPVPYALVGGYNIFVDGKPYTAGLGPCDDNTVVFYSYALAVGQGKSGPYLATWKHNGDTLIVTVNTMDELVSAMNAADPAGQWVHNPLFLGFTSPNIAGTYSDMTIRHIATQVTAFIQTNYSSTPMGTTLVMTPGVHEVVFVDKVTGCSSKLIVDVEAEIPLDDDILPESFSVLKGNCDLGYLTYCLPVKYTDLSAYEFQLNGKVYSEAWKACEYVADHFYSYVSLPGLGASGPYRVQWKVNGVDYTGEIGSIAELVARMNSWNAQGKWRLEESQLSIRGGHNTDEYSNMIIRQINTGAISILELNRNLVPGNALIQLPPGRNTLVVRRLADNFRDTLITQVACLTPDVIDNTIPVNQSDTICLNTSELVGEVVSVKNICEEGVGSPVEYVIMNGSVCILNNGKFEGKAKGCFVICDAFGVCDTTYINTTVLNQVSVLVTDTLRTPLNKPVSGIILANDTIRGRIIRVSINQPPRHGVAVINPDNTVTYTPDRDYCNTMVGGEPDKFMYEVCTEYGCYTIYVVVIVQCEPFQIYTGFSPNGDGNNDYWRIEGLQHYPKHSIEVFNRWGNRVFRTKDYKNDWGGNWQQNDLPSGTYFYIIEDGEGKFYSGYIQIRR